MKQGCLMMKNYVWALSATVMLAGCSVADPTAKSLLNQNQAELKELNSGEGRNGPDLSGPAAPEGMDRSFAAKDLVVATERCTSALMKNLYTQFFRRQWTDEKITKSTGSLIDAHNEIVAEDGGPSDIFVGYSGEIKNEKGSTMSFSAVNPAFSPVGIISRPNQVDDPYVYGNNKWSMKSKGVVITLNLAPGDLDNCCAEKMQFGLPWGRPALRFDRILTDLQYDDYGKLTSFKETAKNVALSVIAYTSDGGGNSVPTESSNMPLYRITGFAYSDHNDFAPIFAGPSKITFDAPAYKRCLKGELEL